MTELMGLSPVAHAARVLRPVQHVPDTFAPSTPMARILEDVKKWTSAQLREFHRSTMLNGWCVIPPRCRCANIDQLPATLRQARP